jgi:nitroimidazol reductase NimA-like FMN-containing flavoprotein (pyridoxamine 5'-phosphate oxidase superfamily)
VARRIIGSGLYMVLGTSDRDRTPWVSPVYYAHRAYRSFYWVSSPDAAHSRNIEAHPEVSAVIFDSGAPISTGQAVYMKGVAENVPESDIDDALEVFSARSLAHGGEEWSADDVTTDARLRLYRVTVSHWWVLDPGVEADVRVEVDPTIP